MIVEPAIEDHLHRLLPAPDPILLEMEKSGNDRKFPIIGPLVGRFVSQLAMAIGARRVFEMGSGFGYSTYWFARAVGDQGRVVHTEGDATLQAEAKEHLHRGGLAGRVEFRLGDAVALLAADPSTYDVVFIDVDKEQYPAAFRAARAHVRQGGLILTDNTLWHGWVADAARRDAATEGVREYNRLAARDPGLVTSILPLRDGVGVSLVVKA